MIGAKTSMARRRTFLARRQNCFARRHARFSKFSKNFGRRPTGLYRPYKTDESLLLFYFFFEGGGGGERSSFNIFETSFKAGDPPESVRGEMAPGGLRHSIWLTLLPLGFKRIVHDSQGASGFAFLSIYHGQPAQASTDWLGCDRRSASDGSRSFDAPDPVFNGSDGLEHSIE